MADILLINVHRKCNNTNPKRRLFMKILITGGAGFIGSHTANQLIQLGHEVTVYDNLLSQVHSSDNQFPKSLHPKITKIKGDIRDYLALSKAVEGQDVIYHFASLTGVGQSMYQFKDYIDVNCNGTANLMEAIIHAKYRPQKVILSSSRAVYGEGTHACKQHPNEINPGRKSVDLQNGIFEMTCPICQSTLAEIPVTEERSISPLSIYAETKRNQEEYLKYLALFYKIPVTILRYFNVYGSEQSLKNPYTGILTVFFNQIQNNQTVNIYEKGKPTRDFVHVKDVVQANLLALSLNHTGSQTFNIGSGKKYFIREAAEMLTKACQKKAQMENTNIYRAGDILACTADITKSKSILQYQPKVTLQQGIEEFVKWALQQKSTNHYENTVNELSKHNLIGNALCTTK